jgi:hypothetical protein
VWILGSTASALARPLFDRNQMKITSRRTLAAVVGVSAVAAVVGSVLTSAPASASNAARIQVFNTNARAAAGTCLPILFTPVDQFGNVSQSSDVLTVRLDENPNTDSQDVDFCVTDAQVPSVLPNYLGGDDVSGPTRSSYNPGPGVTGMGATSGGTPDRASTETESGGGDPTCDCATANPDGTERARYAYQPGSGGVRVGVVGLTTGGAKLTAWFDDGPGGFPFSHANNWTPDTDEVQAPIVSVQFTPGGQPGSAEAAAAVTKIVATPADDTGAPGAAQNFTAALANQNNDAVRGVRPNVVVSGPNSSATPTCDISDNAGLSRCSYTGVASGTDSLTVYVNKAGPGFTGGVDTGETRTTITRTTSRPSTAAAEARYLTLTPTNQQTPAGQTATFTATVTDVQGAPSQGVSVVFTESGTGAFVGGSSSVTTTTDATGRAVAKLATTSGDLGSGQITATIATGGTQCGQSAGAGTGAGPATPAGRCSDTVSHSVVTPPSPTPTPSPSPTGTRSPSPSPSGGREPLSISTSTPDIQPTQTGVLNVTGSPGGSVELRCYTRPNVDYFTARGPQNLSASGTWQFQITPGANTRCYVRYAGDETTASPSTVINVHTTLSLSAVRQAGDKNYLFQGRNLPRRSGQLITLYRIDNFGNEVRTANLTTDDSGIYRVARHFTGTGTFSFIVRTSKTLNNAEGQSATYRITIR